MKQRFILFRRAGVFYYEDTTTGQQISLRTKDEAEALTLLHSKNESFRQPVLNLHIARTYLTATEAPPCATPVASALAGSGPPLRACSGGATSCPPSGRSSRRRSSSVNSLNACCCLIRGR